MIAIAAHDITYIEIKRFDLFFPHYKRSTNNCMLLPVMFKVVVEEIVSTAIKHASGACIRDPDSGRASVKRAANEQLMMRRVFGVLKPDKTAFFNRPALQTRLQRVW